MIPTIALLLLALLKVSTAKLLLSALIVAIAIAHEMITISANDGRKKDSNCSTRDDHLILPSGIAYSRFGK
ncbi:hypothetical protein BJY04DRAFT_175599 [Aspergillus karnatakaensis]|uniref:uncharacterized protein n=1 Tax=Aspergillus karnatakaensis TaxID=1810916 RepID=UPI003CCDF6FA